MADRLLLAADFRAWLEAQPRSTCIGVAGRSEACPLARYLGPGMGVDGARYGPTSADGWEGWLPLPPWARRFVALVDALPGLSKRPRRVYPRLALALLDEALAAAEAVLP
jgi:hypothetical protein